MIRFFMAVIFIIVGVWLFGDNFPRMGFWHTQQLWMPENYSQAVRVTLDDDGKVFEIMTKERTVKDFFKEQKIAVSDDDVLRGSLEDIVYEGKRIVIERAKHIAISVGEEKHSLTTHQTSIEKMLVENNINMGADDFILPKNEGVVIDKTSLSVIRVIVREEVVDKPITFTKTVEEDGELSWRKIIVAQKGEDGTKRFIYKVISHNGKEIDRKVIKQEVIKEPVVEKTIQGTYVAVKSKASTGLGTWYAYTGTLSAASPWLPMGSYARVTNQENGKTVIVKINDRGPFGKNRILDLDKVAFAKIASIGAGVISLKVEEVTN